MFSNIYKTNSVYRVRSHVVGLCGQVASGLVMPSVYAAVVSEIHFAGGEWRFGVNMGAR